MSSDSRDKSAVYYDLSPTNPEDVPFYLDRISGPDATILELGCGTGRVLLPLASSCRYIHGIDRSEAMLDICRNKLLSSGIPAVKAYVELGDISDFDLDRKFDFIIAPF
ncbi:MAG: class I SAM-dependent methyltransferase [Dehalococcoidia bacterium]|nr:class I SAM-dependent methyltransferase [Dehalococcoidia bacterium]